VFSVYIKYADTLGAEQPFVAAGGQEIDIPGTNRDHPQTLNGVDTEQYTSFLEVFADGVNIDPVAGDEIDAGQSYQAGTAIGCAIHVFHGDAAVTTAGDESGGNPALGQIEPGIDVGREIAVGNHDIIPRFPGKPGGHQAETAEVEAIRAISSSPAVRRRAASFLRSCSISRHR